MPNPIDYLSLWNDAQDILKPLRAFCATIEPFVPLIRLLHPPRRIRLEEKEEVDPSLMDIMEKTDRKQLKSALDAAMELRKLLGEQRFRGLLETQTEGMSRPVAEYLSSFAETIEILDDMILSIVEKDPNPRLPWFERLGVEIECCRSPLESAISNLENAREIRRDRFRQRFPSLDEPAPSGVHQGPPSNTENWTFEPGKAIYKGIEIPIVGIDWKLLKALVKTHKPLAKSDLIAAGWEHDDRVKDGTIGTHLSAVRKLLCRKLGYDKQFDPIPRRDRRELLAWELHPDLR